MTRPPGADGPNKRPTRILLISEARAAGATLERALETAGHAVHVAAAGPGALRLPLAAIPDLIMFQAASWASETGHALLRTLHRVGMLKPAVTVRPCDARDGAQRYHVTIDAGIMSSEALGNLLALVSEPLCEATRSGSPHRTAASSPELLEAGEARSGESEVRGAVQDRVATPNADRLGAAPGRRRIGARAQQGSSDLDPGSARR